MEPTLSARSVVLLDPHAYRTTPPQEDDIIVARHPRRADLWIVKRVATVLERPSNWGEGRLLEKRGETLLLVLSSDNHAAPGASDSRVFGPVAGNLVLGRVTSRLG